MGSFLKKQFLKKSILQVSKALDNNCDAILQGFMSNRFRIFLFSIWSEIHKYVCIPKYLKNVQVNGCVSCTNTTGIKIKVRLINKRISIIFLIVQHKQVHTKYFENSSQIQFFSNRSKKLIHQRRNSQKTLSADFFYTGKKLKNQYK